MVGRHRGWLDSAPNPKGILFLECSCMYPSVKSTMQHVARYTMWITRPFSNQARLTTLLGNFSWSNLASPSPTKMAEHGQALSWCAPILSMCLEGQSIQHYPTLYFNVSCSTHSNPSIPEPTSCRWLADLREPVSLITKCPGEPGPLEWSQAVVLSVWLQLRSKK